VNFSELSLPLVKPSELELQSHIEWLNRLDKKVAGKCVWSKHNTELNDKAN